MLKEKQAGWGAIFAGYTGLFTVVLTLAMLLPAINVYIVVTILPSLVREIGGEAYYAWAATLFVAASLVGAVLAARLFVNLGPRAACGLAAFIFALGTLSCGFADRMEFFLSARLIQGLGGGLLMTLAYTMIRFLYPEYLWSRILSVISCVWGFATLSGPAIGGIFAEYEIWRAAFWLIGALAFVFTFAVFVVLPKNSTKKGDNASPPLAFFQIAVLLLCVLVISIGSVAEGMDAKIIGLGMGFAFLALLALIEKKARVRLLPQGSFSIRGAHFYLYMLMLILACAVNGSELYIPLFLQILHDVSPLWAGYIAALLSMGWTCGALYSAPVTKNRQPRLVMLSPCFGLVGAILLFFILPAATGIWLQNTLSILFVIGVGLFLIGLSPGMAWPHLLTRVLSWANAADAERASTSITLIQIFSAALGSALAGTLTNLAGLDPLGGRMINIAPAQLLFIGITLLLVGGLFFAHFVSKRVVQESEI